MNIIRFLRKLPLYKQVRSSKLGEIYLKRVGKLVTYDKAQEILNEAPNIRLELKSDILKPKVGIVRNQIGEYLSPTASWLRYERVLKFNNISYGFVNIKKSTWLEECQKFDILLWHTDSTPSEKYEAESKIYILEKLLGKMCFPNFHEIWQYEDKVRAHYLYKVFNLPEIPSFSSNSREEIANKTEVFTYPVISKTRIGAGSLGVTKINTKRQVRSLVKKIFRSNGLKSSFPSLNQHEYVLFQEFIDDASYDLRIMLVGNKAFGYYRYPKKGDFRASGSGVFEKKAIPFDALDLAVRVRNSLESRLLGVDLLYSPKYKQYFIIEASLFNQIDTPSQLVINGVSGYYEISNSNYKFKEGKFWIQELLVKEIINSWMQKEG